ncbi:MAG: hypothetical protein ACRDBH_08905 [Bosea sp. (in: a-proteobacteria)]
MNKIDRLHPIREGFALAGLRTTRGYAEIAAGRLKVIRNGRRTYVRASEIARYIDALEAASLGRAA